MFDNVAKESRARINKYDAVNKMRDKFRKGYVQMEGIEKGKGREMNFWYETEEVREV